MILRALSLHLHPMWMRITLIGFELARFASVMEILRRINVGLVTGTMLAVVSGERQWILNLLWKKIV